MLLPVNSPFMRGQFLQLATGQKEVPVGWFATLKQTGPVENPNPPSVPSVSEEQSSAHCPSAASDEVSDDDFQDPWSLQQQWELQNKFLRRGKRGRENAATLEAENPATCKHYRTDNGGSIHYLPEGSKQPITCAFCKEICCNDRGSTYK